MDDFDKYPPGPTGLAMKCEDEIAKLVAEKITAAPERRKEVNRQIHTVRHMLRWCKSRAGYHNSGHEPDKL